VYENDVASLLHVYRPAVEPLLAELAEHLTASDLEELERLVPELQQRLDRKRFDQDS
jgi:DNA-binding GntR family transcriptional regulator